MSITILPGLDDTLTISAAAAAGHTLNSTGVGATYSNTTVSSGGYTVTNAYPYTWTGTTGANVPNVTIGSGTGITSPWGPTGLSGKIQLDGEDADIRVNGWSLVDAVKKIEERLNILHPNEKMEAEWDQLRELGEQYRALETKLKEQGEMWAKLKAMPPPEID